MSDYPKPPALDEDADVAGERARICRNEQTNDILRIRDLSKVKRFPLPNVTKNNNKKTPPKWFIQVQMFVICQTYKGTIIPAVNRICVGVSPGEVCQNLLQNLIMPVQ